MRRRTREGLEAGVSRALIPNSKRGMRCAWDRGNVICTCANIGKGKGTEVFPCIFGEPEPVRDRQPKGVWCDAIGVDCGVLEVEPT